MLSERQIEVAAREMAQQLKVPASKPACQGLIPGSLVVGGET